MIKEKIKNGEGYIEIEGLGIKTAKEWDEATDPKWDKTLVDYQEQIDKIKNQEGINLKRNDELKKEIENLQLERIELQKEYKTKEITDLLLEYDVKKEEFLQCKSSEEAYQKKMEIKKVENEINWRYTLVNNKIAMNQREQAKRNSEIQRNNNDIELQLQEISNDLQATRQPLNPDYLENQKLKIKTFTKHDYKIVDDDLVLLTDVEKLDIAREKKKKEIANQLIGLYPEKVIDGTLSIIKDEKYLEIDNLEVIEDIRNYKL